MTTDITADTEEGDLIINITEAAEEGTTSNNTIR